MADGRNLFVNTLAIIAAIVACAVLGLSFF
jgi:hypothetical protein